jgi:uncharacterized protein (TIGR03437 family)
MTPAADLKLTVFAFSVASRNIITGQFSVSGSVSSSSTVVSAVPTAVLNSASFVGAGSVAPGTLVTIFGDQLATDPTVSPDGTLPPQLGDTSVLLGPIPLSLRYVSPKQINALVPFGISTNTVHNLVVTRGNTVSVPVDVTVTGIQPGIYTTNQSGTGQGLITNSQTGVIADFASPAQPGTFVTIYCTGLGEVNAADSAGLSTTRIQPTVSIGGLDAPVKFSGLSPGSPGLYQINVVVPTGLQPGDKVPVVVSTLGVTSNVVTISVR